jgi:hypothetical protein
VVEIILERVTNTSMGSELDKVMEFDELALKPEDAPSAVDYRIDSERMQNIERTRTQDVTQREKTRGETVRTFGGSGAIPPASQMLTQGLYQNVEMVCTESIHN